MRVAIQTEEHDYVGRAFGRNVVFSDKVKRQKFSPDTLLWQIKSNKDIRTFLNFSSIYRWQTRKLDDDTTEVRLIDLRYLNKGHYSFAAIAHVDNDNNIDHSYIGWVFTEEKLQKIIFLFKRVNQNHKLHYDSDSLFIYFVAIILEEYLYFECATYLISIKLIANRYYY